MRTTALAAALLLCLGCKDKPAPPAAAPPRGTEPAPAMPLTVPGDLVLGGIPPTGIGADGGATTVLTAPIFLPNDISRSTQTVFLHVDGVEVTPGSSAEFYLSGHGGTFDPADYIGSVGTVVGNPEALGRVTLEVNDFEAEGHKFHARSTLRENAHFGIAMVVKRGQVKVGRFVLTTAKP
jgi:hypothetical protein